MTSGGDLQRWSVDRLDDLVALVTAAMPEEGLGAEDLLACSFEDDGVVLGAPDGEGVVVAVTRSVGGATVGSVQVVAVLPAARRRGVGGALLAGAEAWMADRGATRAVLGGAAPWYLWPGVDVRSTAALCLAEAAGYRPTGCEVNMRLGSTFRCGAPVGIEVSRALDDELAGVALAFVSDRWPHWVAEVGRGVDHGACLVARAGREVVGVACHSVNRPGWLGPMATDPSWRGRGVGAALVGAVCLDLMVAGHDHVEIAWVGPVRFYAKLGAEVSRAFRTYSKALA